MPLYQKLTLQGLDFCLWTIDEDEDELKSMLANDNWDWEAFDKIMHPQKRKEWLATRVITAPYLHNQAWSQLLKDQYGKPYLSNSNHKISIPHTFGWAAVMLSNDQNEVGMDLERIGTKAFTVKDKFLSPHEQALIGSLSPFDQNKSYTLAWSSKEAVYKLYGKKGVDFKAHMQILDFSKTMILIALKINKINIKLKVYHQTIEDRVLCYCKYNLYA